MFIRKLTSIVAVLAAPSFVATSHAHAEDAPQQKVCKIERIAPEAVRPFQTYERYSVVAEPYARLRGAQLYIAAHPGLTAEWLTLSVQRALAETQCGPAVRDVQVSVTGVGPGFWVTLHTAEQRDAATLLRWAEQLGAARS